MMGIVTISNEDFFQGFDTWPLIRERSIRCDLRFLMDPVYLSSNRS